jgi:arylsulfatase A-like enzyme
VIVNLELRQRLGIWMVCGGATSIALGLLETTFTVITSPLARGSWAATLAALLCSFALFLSCSLPLATAGALLEPKLAPPFKRLLPAPPTLLAAWSSALLVTLAAHLLHSQVDPSRYEFLGPVRAVADWLLAAMTFGLALTTLALARILVPSDDVPLARRLFGFGIASLGVAAVALVHFEMSTVYSHRFDDGVAAFTLVALLLAARLMVFRPLVLSRRVLIATLALPFVTGALASQSLAARYLIVTREPVAAASAGWLRRLVDIDRDGSAATLLGGADCAAFDAEIGPGMRESEGTRDLDCRAHVAATSNTATVSASPWSVCLDALRTRAKPLDIVVLTLDALRADTFAAQMPPALREIAKDAAVFLRAYAPSPATYSSVPALFSGHTVSDLARANALSKPILIGENLVVRAFRSAGYRTIGVTLLNRAELGDGFDEFGGFAVDPPAPGGGKGDYYSGALAQQATQRLVSAGNQPTFLWLHQTDTHAPYVPIERNVFPKPEGTEYERAAAYALLRSTEFLQRLLRQRGDTTVVVVTADHGEELSGNGRHGHGPELTEAVLRVPLLLRVPGCPGVTISDPVSVLDVAPTLLELARSAPQPWSLLHTLAGNLRPIPVVAEGFVPGRVERAVIQGHYKLRVEVGSGGKVAFDLDADPNEAHNLYGSDAQISEQLDRAYDSWLSRHSAP